MSAASQSAALDSRQLMDGARALSAAVSDSAAENEAGRRLAPALVDGFRERGLFGLCLPRRYGGSEVSPATLVDVVETLAAADGSAGWCVAIAATSAATAAYLPPDEAAAVFEAGAATIIGGVFAPKGRARVDGKDLIVDGRWSFASGIDHCDWLLGGCAIVDPQSSDGPPRTCMVAFPAGEAVVHDTWQVAGLRGTGSHDMQVEGLRVPRSRAVSIHSDPPHEDGALYRFPVFGLLALGIAAVSLGIARRAIDELVAVAGGKVPGGGRRRLAERSAVQEDVAWATAELSAARAYMHDAIGRAYDEAAGGSAIALPERAALRLASTFATRTAARAVDRMYEAGGGTSIYASSPLQRCFRDVHTATQHMMVARGSMELAGRTLLDLETDVSLL